MADQNSKAPKTSPYSGMPADPPEAPGPVYKVQPRTGGEDDMNAVGKYLLLGVPQFAKDPITGNLMTSYLRLGASSSTWQEDPGGWLAAKAHLYGPPGSHSDPAMRADQALTDGKATAGVGVLVEAERTDINPWVTGDGEFSGNVFVDDDRNRLEGAPHLLDKAERLRQSSALHTRGGWRDHSDGNRITTTYGDKIEVIRGNYKQIILGRQDDEQTSAGWDVSGQIIQDFAYMMPGASVRVEESKSYNGVWHLENTMENMVQSTNFAGDFFDYKWGEKHWTFTGSNDPKPKTESDSGAPRDNPHLLEKTWAHRIESYTGSSDWRIGKTFDGVSIIEETYAVRTSSLTDVSESIVEVTNAGSTSSTTTVKGSVSDTTTVHDSVTESTTVTNSISSTTKAGATSDITIVGAASSVTTLGVESDITIKGAGVGVTVVGAQADVTVAGIQAEITINPVHFALEIAAKLDIFIGARMDVQLGYLTEVKAGWKKEIAPFKDTTNGKTTFLSLLWTTKATKIQLG